MKKHIYIFVLTILVITLDSFVYINANNNGLLADNTTLIATLFMMILAAFFPMSIFTCYKLVVDDNKKGHFLENLITGIQDGFMGGLLIVPFLLAPLFIYDYILYFIGDLKVMKERRNVSN